MRHSETEVDRSRAPGAPLVRWVCLLLGVCAATAALLPWLVTGLKLPLQNLWSTATLPADMPVVMLPFTQYAVILLFALLVVGSASAGICARALRARLPSGGAALIMVGTVGVQLIATTQTALVVGSGLDDSREAAFYLAALTFGTLASAAIGVIVFWLIAAAPPAGALLALAVAAIAMGPWISGLLSPLGSVPAEPIMVLLSGVQWIPPILAGVAIAWTRVNTIGRMLSTVVVLALMWVAPAFITGLATATGSRVLASDVPELGQVGMQVFLEALFIPELAVRPIFATIVAAVVASAVGYAVRRSRRKNGPSQAHEAPATRGRRRRDTSARA